MEEGIEFKQRAGRMNKPCRYCGVNDYTYIETPNGFEVKEYHKKTCKSFKQIMNLSNLIKK